MKNKKGITLISLVITVIVLAILASIATYSGVSVIKSSKFTSFTTELKIMQTQVNSIYQEDANGEYGEQIQEGEIKKQAQKVFEELARDEETGIQSANEFENYRYWSKDYIKNNLKIEGVEQDFFVNLSKRTIVSYNGLNYEGKTYYMLSQLPDGLYNVEYEGPNDGKPTFDVNTENIGTNKWKITISNIQYDGYINKWQVNYRHESKTYVNTTEDMSFVVNEKGVYYISIENEGIKSEEKITIALNQDVKITTDSDGKLPANTQIKGTSTYINFDIGDTSKYTITTEPALPLEVTENGKYSFDINITDKDGKTTLLKHDVVVDSYVTEPAYWIDFAGTSHIELNNIDQNDLLQDGFTIATKVNINREQQATKMYMGLWGNHYGNEGINIQFVEDTPIFSDGDGLDYTNYYDKWTDIVITYNATSQEIKRYINGEEKYRLNWEYRPYEGFNIGTSFLVEGYDRQMIGKMTCLKIWDKELTAEQVANIDLFKEEIDIRKDDVYANINLKSEEEINKIGTFVGTGHAFKE